MGMSGSGYQVQPGPAHNEVTDALRSLGISRPVAAGDPMDEGMPIESLRVVVQIGIEHLSRLGGAKTGDHVTAAVVNRGLLTYMRERANQAGTLRST
jgi:hypothetical protein